MKEMLEVIVRLVLSYGSDGTTGGSVLKVIDEPDGRDDKRVG